MTGTVTAAERPILFSGPMVKAILDGHKTMSRRVIFRDGDPDCHMPWRVAGTHWQDGDDMLRCPYGEAGKTRLWVRETFRAIEDPGADDHEVRRKYRDDDGETHYIVVDYKADAPTRIMDKIGKPEWKPSIHMPRWASRITLELIEVRVERLIGISELDCEAELGVESYSLGDGAYGRFRDLWQSINGKRPGCAWESNPWVWCLSFRRLTPTEPT